jgi:PAS domain S-box-containing protein
MEGNDVTSLPSGMDLTQSDANTAGLVAALVELMPDAALVVDSEGLVLGANAQALAMFGYEKDEIEGHPVEVLVPEQARERHHDHRSRYGKSPKSRPMGRGLELAGRRRDGSEFPVDISLAPLRAGGVGVVVAAVRDMTEHQRASAAERLLATIVNSSLDAIVSTTREGEVSNWNSAAEELYGYEASEMLGEKISRLIPPESEADFQELLEASFNGEPHGALDTRWLTKDRALVDVAVSASPLYGPDKAVRGVAFICRDIRERKVAETELRRLLAEEQRLERQHAATAEIRLSLLSDRTLEESLTLICRSAGELVGASFVSLVLRDGENLSIVAASGKAEPIVGLSLQAADSFAEQVIRAEALLAGARRSQLSRVNLPPEVPDGPILGVPVVAGGRSEGALVLVRQEGESQFSAGEQLFAEALAGQAALAIELDTAKEMREQMMLIGDRERIGRDLHDHVIQRLFAAGLGLQGSLSMVERDEAKERIAEAITALDETIQEIRNTIFELSSPRSGDEYLLRARAVELTEEMAEALGFTPRLRLEGPVDTAVTERLVPHVMAVVREALSNTARHANASKAEVRLQVASGELTVTVTDDGIGLAKRTRTSGLGNLAERARLFGGELELTSGPEIKGTRLSWRVPLT